ncbi:MAG: hypothetical protein AAB538_00545, partial [Patescibacteria group bacterium]
MSASIKEVIEQVAGGRGYEVEKHLTGRGRYEYAILRKGERRAFLKAGFHQQEDLDEPKLLPNLQREIWWARVIEALERQKPSPPAPRSLGEVGFTSPRLIDTNITPAGCADEVGWVVFEYESAEPFADIKVERFSHAIPKICATLNALNNIHPATLAKLSLPSAPPVEAHGEAVVPEEFWEVIQREQLLEMNTVEHIKAALPREPLPR